MPENLNPLPQDENVDRNENSEQFESDTQRIIRRHLENKDDIITDEDIANVRVGMTPPQFDEATAARFEDEEAREEAEDNIVGETDDDEHLEGDRITPWDAVDPDK